MLFAGVFPFQSLSQRPVFQALTAVLVLIFSVTLTYSFFFVNYTRLCAALGSFETFLTMTMRLSCNIASLSAGHWPDCKLLFFQSDNFTCCSCSRGALEQLMC